MLHKTFKIVSIVTVVGLSSLVGYTAFNNVRLSQEAQSVARAIDPIKDINAPCRTTANASLSPVSALATNTVVAGSNNDTAIFTIHFSVQAQGCNIFIPKTLGSSTSGNVTTIGVTRGIVPITNGVTYLTLAPDHPSTVQSGTNQNWRVIANTTEGFFATVHVQNPAAGGIGNYKAYLQQIRWDKVDTATPANVYTSGLGTATAITPYTTNVIQMN